MYVSEINHTNFDGRVQVDACVVGRTLKERENVRDKHIDIILIRSNPDRHTQQAFS